MIPDVNDIALIATIVGEVAKGSVLQVQFKEFSEANIQPRVSGTSSGSMSSCEREPSNVVERRENLRTSNISF